MSKNNGWQNLAVDPLNWDLMGKEEKLFTVLAKSFLAPNETLEDAWAHAFVAIGAEDLPYSKNEVFEIASERAQQLMAYKASHRITLDIDNLDEEGFLIISKAMAMTAPDEKSAAHHVEMAKRLSAVVPDADGIRIRLLAIDKACDIVELDQQAKAEAVSLAEATIGRAKSSRS